MTAQTEGVIPFSHTVLRPSRKHCTLNAADDGQQDTPFLLCGFEWDDDDDDE